MMVGLNLGANEETYSALLKAYAEKQRFYHTRQHIQAMLRHVDSLKTVHEIEAVFPDELELAIWFHDAIYQPFSSKNELNSALWAERFLTQNGVALDVCQRVFQLIMATEHSANPRSLDECLMVDIDLTILGHSRHIYQTFEDNIRREYKWVPLAIYRKKRKTVLQHFLSRKRIYHTDSFYRQFEVQARLNLQRAVTKLSIR